MTSEDLFWLAVCLYHEARGECDEGIQAVAHVILNRAKQKRKTVKEIVLQPSQFSWANNGARPPIKDYGSFVKCLDLAGKTVKEREELGVDFNGADHYHAVTVNPSWAKSMQKIAKVGGHIFYRGK